MEHIQATRKWTELSGLAVVSLDDGRKIGTCDDFYFEPGTQHLYALRVKTGLLSHKLLLVSSINTIGRDAVTTEKEEQLRDESELKNAPGTIIPGRDLNDYKIMSVSGNLIGTLGNVILDISLPREVRLVTYELAGNLLTRLGGHYATFPASRVIRYGQDVLVIPDDVAETLK